MSVTVHQVLESCFITASGCLDAEGCLQLKQAIADAKKNNIHHILVDCKQLTDVTTEALRLVLSQTSSAEVAGVNLVFYQVNPGIHEIINRTGLNSVLVIVPDLQEAYRYCRQFH
jgi:anti-anti-sigma factor